MLHQCRCLVISTGPSPPFQILRVLRPGGVLVGSDSLPSQSLHAFHEGDIYNPVEPAAFHAFRRWAMSTSRSAWATV